MFNINNSRQTHPMTNFCSKCVKVKLPLRKKITDICCRKIKATVRMWLKIFGTGPNPSSYLVFQM